MQPKAIVYSSNTGHTQQYAQLLSHKSGLPCYSLKEAKKVLSKGDPVIYMGWLIAGVIKDYKKVKRVYSLQAVCAVGLGDSGAQTALVRKSNKVPELVKLYTLQGGIDHDQLTGIYKSMIRTLIKTLKRKKNPTADDQAMLSLLEKSESYVSMENLSAVAENFGWN